MWECVHINRWRILVFSFPSFSLSLSHIIIPLTLPFHTLHLLTHSTFSHTLSHTTFPSFHWCRYPRRKLEVRGQQDTRNPECQLNDRLFMKWKDLLSRPYMVCFFYFRPSCTLRYCSINSQIPVFDDNTFILVVMNNLLHNYCHNNTKGLNWLLFWGHDNEVQAI